MDKELFRSIGQTEKQIYRNLALNVIKQAIKDCKPHYVAPRDRGYNEHEKTDAKYFLCNLENTCFYDVLNLSSSDIRKIRREAGID